MRSKIGVPCAVSVFVWVLIVMGSACGAAKEFSYMLGTAGAGGEVYVWGGGAAKVVTQFSPEVQLTAQLTAGSGENVVRLQNGSLNIGLASNEWNWELFNGQGGLPKYEHRAIYAMYQGDWFWACRRTFPGRTISDFKGKKVSFGPKGGGSYGMIKYVLDALGLKFSDFDARYLSATESVDALKDGAIDAFVAGVATPAASLLDLASMRSGLRIISLTPTEIKQCQQKYVFFTETVIPANTYQGVDYETHGVGRWSYMVARADFPDQAAYQIAKALTEHHADLVSVMPAARASTAENTIRHTVIPLHPGVQRYFREKGYIK